MVLKSMLVETHMLLRLDAVWIHIFLEYTKLQREK